MIYYVYILNVIIYTLTGKGPKLQINEINKIIDNDKIDLSNGIDLSFPGDSMEICHHVSSMRLIS